MAICNSILVKPTKQDSFEGIQEDYVIWTSKYPMLEDYTPLELTISSSFAFCKSLDQATELANELPNPSMYQDFKLRES